MADDLVVTKINDNENSTVTSNVKLATKDTLLLVSTKTMSLDFIKTLEPRTYETKRLLRRNTRNYYRKKYEKDGFLKERRTNLKIKRGTVEKTINFYDPPNQRSKRVTEWLTI